MRLFEELFGEADDGLAGARCVWKIGGAGYFEGVKGLTKFTPEQIVLQTRSGEVCVAGKELSVKKYADGDLYIDGKIYSLILPKEGGEPC
ncbi:MAG: YabP/YqfC family sporulation protein [Clostridia bacterium]|nr:YabP/YqfC family sporulation protein [Clostridia bacterium]